jgi:hypothetical protein
MSMESGVGDEWAGGGGAVAFLISSDSQLVLLLLISYPQDLFHSFDFLHFYSIS